MIRARKLLLAAPLLVFGGCGTVSGDMSATIAAVVNATKLLCQFQPTIATVGALITAGTGSPIPQTVEVLAAAICDAVAPAKVNPQLRARLNGMAPSPIIINGVVIHGRFV